MLAPRQRVMAYCACFQKRSKCSRRAVGESPLTVPAVPPVNLDSAVQALIRPATSEYGAFAGLG